MLQETSARKLASSEEPNSAIPSPLQLGMVYHSLTDPGQGIDIEQITFDAPASLDVARLAEAFQSVTEHYAELRTGFRQPTVNIKSASEPTRFVEADCSIPVSIVSFDEVLSPDSPANKNCGMSSEDQWLELVAADRFVDFDLAHPPLQRLLLADLGPALGWRGLWTFHHIILDGRSFPLVLGDVFSAFHTTRGQTERPSYEGFISALGVVDVEVSKPFWSEYLSGVVPDQVLSINPDLDHRHPTGRAAETGESRFGAVTMGLTSEQTLGLQATAASVGCSMNVIVQAAWAILMHRHTAATNPAPITLKMSNAEDLNAGRSSDELGNSPGESLEVLSDIVFGATRACRHLTDGADQMLGLLINTLPTRASVGASTSLGELCDGLATHQLAVRPHEATSLPEVKMFSGLSNDAELFSTLVMYDDATLDQQMALVDTGTVKNFVYKGQTNFPLALICYGGQELRATIEHDRRTIGDKAAQRLTDRLSTLLGALALASSTPGASTLTTKAVAPRDQLVGELNYLSPADEAELASWNQTSRNYELGTKPATLIELFDAQVERTPEAPALSFSGQTVSYREFQQLALAQGQLLLDMGIGPEDLVAILANRSIEMMVAIYGTLYAGAAYCPLDPDYPSDRLRYIIEQSNARALLLAALPGATTDYSHLCDHVLKAEADLLAVGELHSSDFDRPPGLHGARPEQMAYVIYTSGSTGKPKGCVNEHRGIVNRLLWMQEAFALEPTDTVVQKTPFTFDVSVWELFWPLQVGARLSIIEPGAHKEPAKLIQHIADERVTTVHFVPSMLRSFLEATRHSDSVSNSGGKPCGSLRRLICSGEALAKDLADECLSSLDAELHNLYGPTEAAVDVTWHQHQPDSSRSFVPIGAPIANTTIHILDQYLQAVPPGTMGEVYIGGVQVCRGYLRRPDLTAERFLAAHMLSPAAPADNESGRIYRTGDLGRFLPNGQVEYLGRTDYQVKIRGFRIELGEIESALSHHPNVDHCAVVDQEIGSAGRQLVAYLVRGLGPAASDQEIRDHLGQTLTDYMIPSYLVWLDSLPLSSAGKVDRKQLPAPTLPDVGIGAAPHGAGEQAVAAIWKQLIEVESVGRDIPFFSAGGHSLLGITLAIRLSDLAGYDITVTDLLDAPTIAGQARLLAGKSGTGDLADVAKAARRRPHRRKRRAPANLQGLED